MTTKHTEALARLTAKQNENEKTNLTPQEWLEICIARRLDEEVDRYEAEQEKLQFEAWKASQKAQ
jgi:hypothetical protein